MPTVQDDIQQKAKLLNASKNSPKGGFYWERVIYQSPAFLSLGKNAMKTLIAFLDIRIRAKGKKGKPINGKFINLDCLEMPYNTLEKKYKIPRGSIAPAIDALLAKGFLSIKHAGGTFRHDKTIYAWCDNWLLWQDGIVFSERANDVKRGFQGKKLGAVKNPRT